MNIIKNKKAQVFTIIGILIVSLMFVSFEIFSLLHKRDVVKTRISTMDNFLYSLEQNLEREMYISGFRIIFLAESEITSTGKYIDVNDFFNEAFFNGTVNGQHKELLDGATYENITTSLSEKAQKINVEVILTNSTINISQDNPWFIKFTITSNFTMHDKEDLASWNKQQIISASIPISDFEDPIYTVNTFARISRKINQTTYEGNYGNGVVVTNLTKHVSNNNYASNPNAPNFLKRLEGDLSANINGIESFVNLPELSAQGVPVDSSKSVIDYIYFSASNPSNWKITGMPAWVRIDNQSAHLTKYNVTGLTY